MWVSRKYFQVVLLCFLNNWHQPRNNVGIDQERWNSKFGISSNIKLIFNTMMKYFLNVRAVQFHISGMCLIVVRTDQSVPSSSSRNTQYNAHCQDALGLWILVDSLDISGCINWIWNYSTMMDRFSEQSETNIFSDTIIGNCKSFSVKQQS